MAEVYLQALPALAGAIYIHWIFRYGEGWGDKPLKN
jgi:hypothetical protein